MKIIITQSVAMKSCNGKIYLYRSANEKKSCSFARMLGSAGVQFIAGGTDDRAKDRKKGKHQEAGFVTFLVPELILDCG